jgi:hypothetical protein
MERRALLLCDAFFGWPPSWLLPAQMCVMRCKPATGSPSHVIVFKNHMLIMLWSAKFKGIAIGRLPLAVL